MAEEDFGIALEKSKSNRRYICISKYLNTLRNNWFSASRQATQRIAQVVKSSNNQKCKSDDGSSNYSIYAPKKKSQH